MGKAETALKEGGCDNPKNSQAQDVCPLCVSHQQGVIQSYRITQHIAKLGTHKILMCMRKVSVGEGLADQGGAVSREHRAVLKS